jgi:hypothetical protein
MRLTARPVERADRGQDPLPHRESGVHVQLPHDLLRVPPGGVRTDSESACDFRIAAATRKVKGDACLTAGQTEPVPDPLRERLSGRDFLDCHDGHHPADCRGAVDHFDCDAKRPPGGHDELHDRDRVVGRRPPRRVGDAFHDLPDVLSQFALRGYGRRPDSIGVRCDHWLLPVFWCASLWQVNLEVRCYRSITGVSPEARRCR